MSIVRTFELKKKKKWESIVIKPEGNRTGNEGARRGIGGGWIQRETYQKYILRTFEINKKKMQVDWNKCGESEQERKVLRSDRQGFED